MNNYWVGVQDNSGQLRPTRASPTPTSDPEERPRLEAYARYRILILYARQGYQDEAQLAYDTLQKKFPAGSPGSDYTALATAFWDAYTPNADIQAACAAAIAYADAHREAILYPLGPPFYGEQNRIYTAQDICPFGGR